jgi:hypothetical protein
MEYKFSTKTNYNCATFNNISVILWRSVVLLLNESADEEYTVKTNQLLHVAEKHKFVLSTHCNMEEFAQNTHYMNTCQFVI